MEYVVLPDGRKVSKKFFDVEERRKKLGISQVKLCQEAGADIYSYRGIIYGSWWTSRSCDVAKLNKVLDDFENSEGAFVPGGYSEWLPEFQKFEMRRRALGIKQRDLCRMLGVTPQTYRDSGRSSSIGHARKVTPREVDNLLKDLEEKSLRSEAEKRAREEKKRRLNVENKTIYGRCLEKEIQHSSMVKETFECPGKLETDSQCLLREICKKCPYLVR